MHQSRRKAAILREVLIVANRLPVSVDASTLTSGGLVSALAPVSDAIGSTWVGWLENGPAEPFVVDGQRLVAVHTSREQYARYYEGFANQVLWPVFHGLGEYETHPPVQSEAANWLNAYRKVNRAFAERIAEVASNGALVWVQDYHLLLLPEMLRSLRPDLRVAVFLHIPFPDPAALVTKPWARELVSELGAAQLIGTQRERDARHLGAALHLLSPQSSPVVRAFPISIDTAPILQEANRASSPSTVTSVRERLGVTDRPMLLGVDRIDYTKGIIERIEAFSALLGSWEGSEPLPTLVQVLTPTRETIPAYQGYLARVNVATTEVNRQFGTASYTPIVNINGSYSLPELIELFLATDVMCVTPLRDGMNLVAKEFVASRVDDSGVLLLSSEAGAADELHSALIVDPRSQLELTDGMRRALKMSDEEMRIRMRSLRKHVLGHTVHNWASNFIKAAS
ncbi:alpha,alpha-trehalose-phosphate synthase (UDP-forming) [Leucobacter denitrificans]|uniref:alpha,alpha-trehalose-phosphate synthase (UDP-forming) n=1 Tax=Leucobacter denitrificans TaxID=683042 RepID=UPI001FEA73FE|nr:trehalose-6-phosphate synthase [Leucobacter denitrificans]